MSGAQTVSLILRLGLAFGGGVLVLYPFHVFWLHAGLAGIGAYLLSASRTAP